MDDVFTIREYLINSCAGMSSADLTTHFMENFGVHVSNEDDLYLFKYDQISANWNEPITKECRGVILRKTGDLWWYVSIPFMKFFNLGEGKCEFFNDELFNLHAHEFQYVEKIDGSCVQVWYDTVKGEWRASTLGSISTASVFDHPFTFSDLFWKVFGSDRSAFEVGHTYIFELWTKYNQVVTDYGEDRITLLGVRNNETFSLDEVCLDEVSKVLNVKIPYKYSGLSLTKAGLEAWVEEQSLLEEVYGKIPEGFVGFLGNIPKFKDKNTKYCQYHKLITGDRTFVLKNIITTVFHGNIDDIYGDLNEDLRGFVDRLKAKLAEIQATVLKSLPEFSGIVDAKSFAMKLKDLSQENEFFTMYSAFYFDSRAKIVNGESVDILAWMVERDRYLKHTERWKAL